MSYNHPFAEQLSFFWQKVNLPTERWDDIKHAEHDRAFIVAGAQGADLLDDLNTAVSRFLADGIGLDTFRKDFRQIVQAHGWTGWTGDGSKVGEAWRTKVIYQTNMATSYAAGRWAQMTDPELLDILPYWQYHHADGVLYPRPLHLSWDGLTLPHDHPFWATHWPPNGWGCHCRVTAVSRSEYAQAVDAGRGPDSAPAADDISGIDSGFAYAPGASVADELRGLIQSKAATLPDPIAQSLVDDVTRVLSGNRYLDQSINRVGNEIVNEPTEHLVVINLAGDELLRKVGEKYSVSLSDDELDLLPDGVMIHNHPGLPQSFSDDDVKMAIWHRLSATYVFDGLYRYQLLRPSSDSWGPDVWTALKPVLDRIRADVTARLDAALENQLIRADEREVLLEHMVWTNVNYEFDIGYSRKLRSEL